MARWIGEGGFGRRFPLLVPEPFIGLSVKKQQAMALGVVELSSHLDG